LHPALVHHVVNTLGWPQLRPLQQLAIAPIQAGQDALLLAPTAGGKTEAAALPVLSRMVTEQWRGLSVLYVCPLRALLNNLEPRLAGYAGWLGRRVGLWHGDTGAGARNRLAADPPDILLTTPESLESILASTLRSPALMFGQLRTVIIDEVHAFAGDDRGWHLLAVLERLSQLAGRPIQRIGLSATVGNPDQLLGWLQGPAAAVRPGAVVCPPATAALEAEIRLDYVATVSNAAKVISALHTGAKRLVFADSRRTVESLAVALRGHGVDTYVSHSSLSADERRRAETAFAQARNCVIVSTSTLELGIDVGDLDYVIQVGAPGTVASFLQRLGRTGRRPGSTRNLLFLATTDDELLRAAAIAVLWHQGFIEPVLAPPTPRHLLAQQLLALCLQHGQVGAQTWPEQLGGLALGTAAEAEAITHWLLSTGQLASDNGMVFIGPQAERRFGRKHFLELLSVFTADPQFTVLAGRSQIGTVDAIALTREVTGPRVLALSGRPWRVTHIDWRRRHVFVEPSSDGPASTRWSGSAQPLSFALTQAIRAVLLGAALDGSTLTQRATQRLGAIQAQQASRVSVNATVLNGPAANRRWWTWGGGRANALLAAALTEVQPGLIDEVDRYDNRYLRVAAEVSGLELSAALRAARARYGTDLTGILPQVNAEALKQLKFTELLPPELAQRTLAARLADNPGAAAVSAQTIVEPQ
jgi:ATP-dependent helicase Lhr and Lhr-like helicase